MKKIIASVLMLCPMLLFAAVDTQQCSHWISFFKPICKRYHQIMDQGQNELYLSGYAWHNRYTYTPEKIKTYNEAAWGGGFGKGLFDEKGNWHGLYAIAFMDSHNHVEPVVGYAYLKVAHFTNNLKAGLGYSVLVTSRVDIFNSIPFPGAVPWASIFYKQTSISAAYIPGSAGAGNVLYIVAKYSFG